MNSKSSTRVSSPAAGWDVGMLVQQRNSDSNNPVSNNIRVQVKHGSSYHQVTFAEKASSDIAAIRIEVDNLAKQVSSIEMEIKGGKKYVEAVIVKLIEMLMTQLINLDGIPAHGNLKSQRKMQVKRVQKYIETLDLLKTKNAGLAKLPLHPTETFPKLLHEQQTNSESVVTKVRFQLFDSTIFLKQSVSRVKM